MITRNFLRCDVAQRNFLDILCPYGVNVALKMFGVACSVRENNFLQFPSISHEHFMASFRPLVCVAGVLVRRECVRLPGASGTVVDGGAVPQLFRRLCATARASECAPTLADAGVCLLPAEPLHRAAPELRRLCGPGMRSLPFLTLTSVQGAQNMQKDFLKNIFWNSLCSLCTPF